MSEEFFEKVQVSAITDIVFDAETFADGTTLRSPVKFVQIEVGYPDFYQPVGPDGKANIQFQNMGVHSNTGEKKLGAAEIARWTKDNASDTIIFSFLKLAEPAADFDPDEVIIRKTISFDPSDPRVELSSGGSTFVREVRTKNHAPVINAAEVGYIYVRFSPDRKIPNGVTMTLTCAILDRKDVLTITHENQKNITWEIFSDKFIDATSFTYDLQVEVVGPNLIDVPVMFGTPVPIEIPLRNGREKYIDPLYLPLPPVPPEKVDTVNRFVRAGQTSAST